MNWHKDLEIVSTEMTNLLTLAIETRNDAWITEKLKTIAYEKWSVVTGTGTSDDVPYKTPKIMNSFVEEFKLNMP
jgi:hypothetical protein